MIWDKLVDRCLLFTDAPSGLLRELLKEAEQELANKLELYDAIYTITVPDTISGLGLYSANIDTYADHNYIRLPENYIRDIAVKHNGFNLEKLSEEDIYRKSDSSIPRGTPTGYAISGDYIVFSQTPSAEDKFNLYYKATLDDMIKDKVLTIHHYVDASTDQIFLGTTLGSLLDGKTFQAEANYTVLSNGTTSAVTYSSSSPIPDFTGRGNDNTDGVSRFDVATPMTSGSGSTLTNWIGAMGRLIGYRDVAPVIPDKFHKDLCNYAVAIANAKGSPDMYDKYWNKWELNIGRLINEAQDRDLIFTVREEL